MGLLDSLMGRDRHLPGEQQRVLKYADADQCKNFLLGLCPHELFSNTKYDLGTCSKEHVDRLKEQFERDPKKDHYRKKWRSTQRADLTKVLEAVDRRIAQNKAKITRGQNEHQQIGEEQEKKIKVLKDEMTALLKQAEGAADEGLVEDSQALVQKTETIKKEIEELSQPWF